MSIHIAVLGVCVALLACGCTPTTPAITSVWPPASSEATIPMPASLSAAPLRGLPLRQGSSVPTVPVCVIVSGDATPSPIGIGQADVVYETADLGTGTQLACLFQSDRPLKVGPVGNAGMPDLWIVPQYRAMLFSQGGTPNLNASMARWPQDSNASRDQRGPFDSAYRGGTDSTYVDGKAAFKLAAQFASSVTSSGAVSLRFSASTPASGSPIAAVTVPFSAGNSVVWAWDRKSGRYLRSVGTIAAVDGATRQRISASNVVVLWVRYSPLDADLAGGGGYDVTLGGSGQASVFRNGKRYDGRWKADGSSPPRLLTEDGTYIRLAPGLTWIEAIPLSANITLR